jgi:hypothetical protein
MLQNVEHTQDSGFTTPRMVADRFTSVPRAQELDSDIWVHRDVYGLSRDELSEVTHLFNPKEAQIKAGRYSLSLVVPGEVVSLMKASGLTSVESTMLKGLMGGLPDSGLRQTVAVSEGLQQFHRWISVRVNYSGFDEEREYIKEYFRKSFGVKHEWDMGAHISLAHGSMHQLTNRDAIEEALPRHIQFGEIIEGHTLTSAKPN